MSDTYLVFRKRLASKRKKLNLTLQALADRSGVSKSIISKIERAQVQPTIETASRIAQGLNSTLSEMFLTEQVGKVIHHPADKQFILDGGSHLKKIMSPSMRRSCIEVFREHLDTNASVNNIIHSDAESFILAIDGGLTVNANDTEYSLETGDCIHIERNVKHSLQNKVKAKIHFITIIHRKDI